MAPIGFTIGYIERSLRDGWVGPLSFGKRSPSPMVYFDSVARFYNIHILQSALDDLSPAQFSQRS